MASRSGALSVKNRSEVWPEAAFRGFEDWRLKMTAAKVRVYEFISACQHLLGVNMAYRSVLRQLNLLREAHQEHLGPLGHPFLVQLRLGSRSLDIVGRLQAL